MAMGAGPQAGHDVFLRVPDDENCCNLAQCKITYYIFFSILGSLACLFSILVLFSGNEWMGLLTIDLIVLCILWGTFCCVYGCCCRPRIVVTHAVANPHNSLVGVQLGYPAAPGNPGVPLQGYPAPGIVHQGYPVQAPAPQWPAPSPPPKSQPSSSSRPTPSTP